jgi:hypothetical protein
VAALEKTRMAAGIQIPPQPNPAPAPAPAATPPSPNKDDGREGKENRSDNGDNKDPKSATPKATTPKPAPLVVPENGAPANPVAPSPKSEAQSPTPAAQPPVSVTQPPVPVTQPPASAAQLPPLAADDFKSQAITNLANYKPSDLHKGFLSLRSNTIRKAEIAREAQLAMVSDSLSTAKKLVEIRKYIRENAKETGYRPGFLAGKLSNILHQAEMELIQQLEKQPLEKAIGDLQDYVNKASETKQVETLTFGFRSDQKKKLQEADTILKLFAPFNEGKPLSASKEALEKALAEAIAANTAATTSTPFKKGRLDEIFKNIQSAMKADASIESKLAVKCS